MAFDHSLHTFRPRRFDKDLHTYKPKYNRHPPGDMDKPYKIQKELTCDSLSFDGVDDYINCGDNVSLDFTEVITISAWVTVEETLTNYKGFIGKTHESSWQEGYGIYYADNLLHFWVSHFNNYDATIAFSTTEAGWHHIVGIYDKNDGYIRIYKDTVEGTAQAYSSDIIPSTYSMYIGMLGKPLQAWKGFIADVQIYNRAISSSERASLFRSKSISNAGLVLHLPLTSDYNTKTVVKDESGNGNDGTLHGCSWNCHWDRKRIYEEV